MFWCFFSLTIGTDESLLDKFNQHHASSTCYEMPPTRESVFSILHYAGRVKYQIEVSIWVCLVNFENIVSIIDNYCRFILLSIIMNFSIPYLGF